jgi:hypothetical protein
VAALAPPATPSGPGKTTVSMNSGFVSGATGLGVGIAHRLNTPTPFILSASYGNGGGAQHVGRLGMSVEF